MTLKHKLWFVVFCLIFVALFLFPSLAPAQTSIPCGQILTGTLGTIGEKDEYAFTVNANDAITIWLRVTAGGMDPRLELLNSSGTVITSGLRSIDTTLTASGTYKIRVSDYGNDETGNYKVTWHRRNNPCTGAPVISCGQIVSGSISDELERDFYSITVNANDAVTIWARGTMENVNFVPSIGIYNSRGSWIGSSGDFTFTAAGTYYLGINDSSNNTIGDYKISWHKRNNPCNITSITCGQNIVGTISDGLERDFYTFAATAGDKVTIQLGVTSGDMNPFLELFDSTGRRITYSVAEINTTLTTGGNYIIGVSDSNHNGTGRYTLIFQKNNNTCPEVAIITPNGGEVIAPGSPNTITWNTPNSNVIVSQEIWLSTDGGQTFPTSLAIGLAGYARSLTWTAPAVLSTTKGRIRVIVTDTSGIRTPDDSDDDFIVLPVILSSYTYDKLNRLIQIDHEDGTTITYKYDSVGNRITHRIWK